MGEKTKSKVASLGIPDFIPVPPFRTRSGSFPGLIPLLGDQGSKPVPLRDPKAALNNFNVVSGSMSISLAVSLGLGSIFKGSVGVNEKAFFLDAMTYTEEYAENPLPGGGVYATRWGVGIRIYLRVQDFAANASLNFGLVGAAVELKQATAQYEITGVGIGPDGLVAVLEEVPALGDFRYETYLKINGVVAKRLATYIRDNKDALTPQPTAVAAARSVDSLANARAVYYAIRRIADRKTLAEALTGAAADIDRDNVRLAYATVAQVQNDNERPQRDAEERAERWLRV